MLRFRFQFCLILFACIFCTFFAHAQTHNDIVIKVGYTERGGIIVNANSVDKQGYGYDILKKIEQSSEFSFEFVKLTKEGALQALKNKEIDLFGPILASQDLGEEFTILPTSIGKMQALLASKSEEVIFYNDLESINNSTVAVRKDSPLLPGFNKYLERHGIKVNYIFGTYDDLSKLEADYYLTTNIDTHFTEAQNAVNLSKYNMHFLGNKENTELNRRINQELSDIALHEANFFDRAYLTYYDNNKLTKKYLTKAESELLKGKHFTVGFTNNHQPIQFISKDGMADGVSIEILNMLAKQYGFTVSYIGYDPTDLAVSRKDFDLLISIQDNYEDIHTFYNHTDAYLRLPMVLMLNLENDEIFDENAPINIGLYHYTTLDYNAIKEEFPLSKLHHYSGITQAFSGYISNKFRAGLFTITGAEYVHASLGGDKTKIIGTDISLPLRFFISHNLSNEYVSAFNNAIRHLNESTLNEIVSRQSLEFIPSGSIISLAAQYLPQIIIAVLFFILVSVAFFLREHKKKRLEIQHVINTDSLTGLRSLHSFKEEMQKRMDVANSNEFEIMTIDIDYFRIINNMFGFEQGSKTICAIAKALAKAYKDSDALVSRISGDLFVILHRENSEEEIEYICYKHIVPAIEDIVGKNFTLSMSMGSYLINDCSQDISAIIDKANIARLSGKKEHDFTYKVFDEKMQQSSEKQADIVFRMEQAVKDKEFKVFYQPKIDYNTLQVIGAEALIRWFPQDSAVFYPDDFIPVFEANGFIKRLDLYVFEEVFKFIKMHLDTLNVPKISVNISGITLFDSSTPIKIEGLLKKYNIDSSHLEVEVTESAILNNDILMSEKVDDIKQHGFTISMDDFGAGVSSLNRLAMMNIDIIKLDKSFLDHNTQVDKGLIIIENIIKMAKELNMKVVSEGVETAEQAAWLKSVGCDFAQGYYFERPLSEESFIELIKQAKKYSLE